VNDDGSGVTPLPGGGDAFNAAWSPDGKRIAFTTRRDGNPEIYLMDADGGDPTNLTKGPGLDDHAVWSPDGKRIAFVSEREGQERVYVMNADGSGQRKLAAGSDPAWSPDGRQIVFAASVPHRSPDGKLIAFPCQAQPSAFDPGYSRIGVMDANGSNVGQPPPTPATGPSDGAPSWSPDGEEIAFDRGVRDEHALFVMATDGSGARQVTPWWLSAGQPDWWPDGTRLLFTRTTRSRPSRPTCTQSGPTGPTSCGSRARPAAPRSSCRRPARPTGSGSRSAARPARARPGPRTST
jgi:Tol biopolymer transport system component